MEKYAYVSLLFPNKNGKCDYLDGAILMALGLRYQKVKYKIICMITTDISDNIKNILKIVYDEIIIVDYISPLSTGIKIQQSLFSPNVFKNENEYTEMCKVFTKLHIFDSEKFPYEKILFIDNDIIPIKNYESLFELNTPAGWLEKINENIGYERIWGNN